MVKPELIKFTNGFTPMSGKITRRSTQYTVKQLERSANGAWFITVAFDFEFELKDGRTVTMNKQVRLRGQQTGTKPHAARKSVSKRARSSAVRDSGKL